MQSLFQSFGVIPPPWRVPVYTVGALAMLLALGGTWARVRLWGMGRDDGRGPLAGAGLGRLVWLSLTKVFAPDCLLARRVFARSRWRGWMVIAFVWGSLAVAAAVLLSAGFYLANRAMPVVLDRWASPVLDAAGLILLLGLLAALGRRHLFPPQRWISVSADGVLLILFTLVVFSGLFLEGVRLAGSGWEAAPRWPVGASVGVVLSRLDWPPAFWGRLYLAAYLAHAGFGFGLVAYLPFSKLFHLVASQITTFAAGKTAPRRPMFKSVSRGSRQEVAR